MNESYNDDMIHELILLLDLPSVLSLCQTNKQIQTVCQQPNIWHDKLKLDFPTIGSKSNDYKKEYINLYSILYHLDTNALEKLCNSNDSYINSVCQNTYFWKNKAKQERLLTITIYNGDERRFTHDVDYYDVFIKPLSHFTIYEYLTLVRYVNNYKSNYNPRVNYFYDYIKKKTKYWKRLI